MTGARARIASPGQRRNASVGLGALCIAFLVSLTSAGCFTKQTWVSQKRWFGHGPKPTRMVVMLSPSMTEDRTVETQQGIMVRTYFFAGQDPVPVRAEGKLVFTAYDRATPIENRPPDGLFEIAAEELPKHLRTDIVGDSYVFWLPFQPGHPTQVAVQARLYDRKGDELSSSLVSVELTPPDYKVSKDSGPQIARPEPYFRTRQKVIGNPQQANVARPEHGPTFAN